MVNDQTALNVAALVATPPGDDHRNRRDLYHLKQHALSDLVATLQGYAAAGTAMEHALANAVGDEEDDQ